MTNSKYQISNTLNYSAHSPASISNPPSRQKDGGCYRFLSNSNILQHPSQYHLSEDIELPSKGDFSNSSRKTWITYFLLKKIRFFKSPLLRGDLRVCKSVFIKRLVLAISFQPLQILNQVQVESNLS